MKMQASAVDSQFRLIVDFRLQTLLRIASLRNLLEMCFGCLIKNLREIILLFLNFLHHAPPDQPQ